MPDWNTWANVSRIWNGFFQIYDGSTAYKFMHPISMSGGTSAVSAAHYSTTGKKELASVGYESRYTITVESTADLYDTASPARDGKTISYFMEQIMQNKLPDVEFEGVQITDASNNKYVRMRFKGKVVDVQPGRNTSSGTDEVTLIMDFTEIIKVQRTNS